MKKIIQYFSILYFIILIPSVFSQIWDDYDGTGDLTYSQNNPTRWTRDVANNVYKGATGGVSGIDYSSYDMSLSIPSWELSKTKNNEWTAWMSDTRTSVSGWGSGYYSFGFVLAANNSDFTNTSCSGYALIYRNTDDNLVLVRFPSGITSSIESQMTTIISTGFVHNTSAGTATTNGVNVYVKYNSDGTWTIKWKSGNKFTTVEASDPNYYNTSTVTSLNDEYYSGINYKYSGWIWNHSTSGSAYSFWDNFGFSQSGGLPVELNSFTAFAGKSGVQLNWSTATEVNNYGFDIERCVAQISNLCYNWEKIGFVQGHGNSNSPKDYTFVDANPPAGKVLYKLKQIDFDGAFEYSKAVEVNVETPKEFRLAQNYPNPFNPSTVISYQLPMDGNVTLKVYDMLGKEVTTLVNELQRAGSYNYQFSINNLQLSSGVYYYRLQSGNFVETKKFIVMK